MIQAQSDEIDDKYRMQLSFPDFIHSKLCKYFNKQVTSKAKNRYTISKALKMMNVTSEEFKNCWQFVKKNTTHEELFCLLKEARFGPRDVALAPKLDFVRKVLQRHEDAKVCVFSLSSSISFLHLLL